MNHKNQRTMQMMVRVLIVVLFIPLLMAISCRSTKTIRRAMAVPRKDTTGAVLPSPTPESDSAKLASAARSRTDSFDLMHATLAGLAHNHIDFNTFSAKVKVSYESGEGNATDFTAYIRIKKDSMIWVSVTALLGIEAFRMLITPDTVVILDKLKKIARVRRVDYLQQDIHLPVNFKTLQDLLIGNPVYLDTSNALFYVREPAGLSIMSADTTFKNYMTVNLADHTIRHSKLDDIDPMSARTCDLTYGDYEQHDGLWFSTYRKISVAEKSKLDLELNFKQYNFNTPLSFPFSIPKNYKRK